jgi:hypothetical protein
MPTSRDAAGFPTRQTKGVSVGSKRFRKLALLLIAALAVGLVTTIPASGKAKFRQLKPRLLDHLSSGPVTRYYLSHPELAPAGVRSRFQGLQPLVGKVKYRSGGELNPPIGDRFNDDTIGLPQNEESVGVCAGDTNNVLEGTNDYRGLLDPEFNFTGWHYSNNGGVDLTNEGLLPHIVLSDGTTTVPSGGDPVDVCSRSGGVSTFYAASLNFDPFFGFPSAIGAYKSDPATLASCPGGVDPSCWPTSIAVAEAAPDHFLDKEWMHVGDTGDGIHVWVTWSDFDVSQPCCFADIMASRCLADLSSCSTPIQIDDPVVDEDIQFSDVTIGPDHRTYFTYAQIIGEIEGTPQTFVVKSRIADVGCGSADGGCLGPIHEVDSLDKAIPFGGFLQADDFRVASVPKSTVKLVNGSPRFFVVYDECKVRVNGDVLCEEPRIEMRYSDDDGATWSDLIILSKTAVNRADYFPSIANDTTDGKIVVAWFTNRFDEYLNAQDIEMVTIDAATATVVKRQQVTTDAIVPNEPEADPLLGGFFIGDYIEVFAHGGQAYIGYNMNIRGHTFIGEGEAVKQQDNFLTKISI